ncbi:MAG: Fic family protein [Candidatus Jorgensenbacteria bacterium]
MGRPQTRRDIEVLEERGLWAASSYLHRIIKRLIRKNAPLEIRFIKEAHRVLFMKARQPDIAGKYRLHNSPELKRIDGTPLPMVSWENIPNTMAELDFELRESTRNLRPPRTHEEYLNLIETAARLSHRLACIHPFQNGNGRSPRLLSDGILLRGGLSPSPIKKSKKHYLRAMRQADDGDFSVLEHLIIEGLLEIRKRNYEVAIRKQRELAKKKLHQKKRRLAGALRI